MRSEEFFRSCSKDEALGLPSEAAAVLALRRLPVQLTECWSGSPRVPILRLSELERRRAA